MCKYMCKFQPFLELTLPVPDRQESLRIPRNKLYDWIQNGEHLTKAVDLNRDFHLSCQRSRALGGQSARFWSGTQGLPPRLPLLQKNGSVSLGML